MSNRFVIFDNKPYGIRAGGIVVHDGKILLIRRIRNGEEFYVFPGGGVDPGETVQQGIIREILEETNQNVFVHSIPYHLDFIDDSDQYYGICKFESGGEVRLNGPEADHQTEQNQYHPCWVAMSDIPALTLYPVMVKEWLLMDAPHYFTDKDMARHWRGVFNRPQKSV